MNDMAAIVTPLVLRKVDPRAALLQTRLTRPVEPLQVTGKGAVILAALDAPRLPAGDMPWLHMTLDGYLVALQVPWGLARRLVGMPVEGAVPEDAALLMEEALAPWLDEVEAALGLTIRFTALRDVPEDLPENLAVPTTLNVQGKDAGGQLLQMRQAALLSHGAAAALATVLETRTLRESALKGLSLQLAFELDALWIAKADFADLEPGDAIEMPERADGWMIAQNHMRAPAIRGAQGVTLKAPFAPIDPEKELCAMTELTEDLIKAERPDETPLTPVEDIDIRLSFRAGEARMSIADLRALAPGAIIETTDPATLEIDIYANGQPVGTGEMIDVGGRRAVQIRRIFAGR